MRIENLRWTAQGLGLGFSLFLLSACTSNPTPEPVAATPPTPVPVPAVHTATLPPPPPPAPVTTRKPEETPREVRRTEERKTEVPLGFVLAVGLGEDELRSHLGAPIGVDEDPPGKMLRYRKGSCTLTVALYPDVETRIFHTLSYEVTSDDHNAGAKQLCETKFGNVAAD